MSIERARELRRNTTIPERAMWRLLKPFRDEGFYFRRQVQIGRYYADFASHREKIVVEVDGDTHGVGIRPEYDKARDAYMQERGFKVLRFSNAQVLRNSEGVFYAIEQALKHNPPTPTLPAGGREKKENE